MSAGPHAGKPLAARQRDVLRLVARFYEATGEFPSACCIARRLGIHHSTVQYHLRALHRAGWLKSPKPDGLLCTHVPPESATQP